tara:strand:- start:64 stop:339 length:276 start_codon:yes stop_codon:yes gene_type:complete
LVYYKHTNPFVKENKVNKIKLSAGTWISLYSELSDYVLTYSSLDPVTEINDCGDEYYTPEKQIEFCDISDEVEAILENHFVKYDAEEVTDE